MSNPSKLNIARGTLVLGLLIGMISFMATIGHIGNPDYLLIPGTDELQTHAWYHALREATGDVASMGILLLTFFGQKAWRTRTTWIICLIIMVGYFAPFWIGAPFSPALNAPSWAAEIVHVIMAALPFTALFLARQDFLQSNDDPAQT